MDAEKRSLTLRIMAYDLAAGDARLYLDTHPECREALDYLNKNIEKRNACTAEYEKKYGATGYGSAVYGKYRWIDSPWPWEREC